MCVWVVCARVCVSVCECRISDRRATIGREVIWRHYLCQVASVSPFCCSVYLWYICFFDVPIL